MDAVFSHRWAGGRGQTLKGHAVDDIGDFAVAELPIPFD